MKKIACWFALAGAVSLTGCGAGGGSSATSTTRASVLITDSFREDYAHVWATIYHVELIPATGSPVVLYDDATGKLIDLKTLRDSTGERFSFLGSAAIPAGTYTSVKITVGKTMQLFRNGVAVGTPLTVDTTLPVDSNGNPVLTKTFATPKVVGSTPLNVVVDFDLAHFIIRGSNVIPAIAEGGSTGLTDPSRHNCDDYHGTVSNLTGTAPDLTFTLTRGNAQTVTVTTTASTALYGTTTLANGSIVDIRGTLDTTAQTLVATAVEVKPTTAPPSESDALRSPKVEGAASVIDATAGTFTIAASLACGFTPTQTSVSVVTTSTTVYRADNGQTQTEADFFTALTATPSVSVEGTYDSTTNTLTATSLRVVNSTNDGGWVHDQHHFRPGTDMSNWGNDARGHGPNGH